MPDATRLQAAMAAQLETLARRRPRNTPGQATVYFIENSIACLPHSGRVTETTRP